MLKSRLKARSSSSKKLSFSFSDGHFLHSRIRFVGKTSSTSKSGAVKDVPPRRRLWPQRRTSTTTTDTITKTASVIQADEAANLDTDTTGKCPFKHGTVYGTFSSLVPTATLLVLNAFLTMTNHSFVFVHKSQHVHTLDMSTATQRRESAQMVADLK